jgi:hypothetical protein
MAEDKKGFILYADLIHTFDHLTVKDRGLVITWVLEYVNDRNPAHLKGLLAAVCEPIKLQLKRDLEKYTKVKEGYSKAGKASAEARRLKKLEYDKQNPTTLNDVKNVPTISTVSDTVNVNVTDKEINNYKEDSFNSWWLMYDNKKGLAKSKAKFLKLSDNDIQAILKITPVYVSSTPDIKYRKLPLTWLNGEHWNDDLTTKKKKFINPCF